MLSKLRARLGKDESGFTLIELMVVVLIIAILIAIAIPTFLGQRQKAQDKQAQSNLRNALTAEKSYYVDSQVYTTDAAAMEAIEPVLAWNGAVPLPANATPDQIYQLTGDLGATICMEAKSASGTFFAVGDATQGLTAGTKYKKGPVSNLATCDAATVATWGVTW